MAIFDSFREEGYPTMYADNRTAAKIDLYALIILAVVSMFLLAFFLILPGIRGIEV